MERLEAGIFSWRTWLARAQECDGAYGPLVGRKLLSGSLARRFHCSPANISSVYACYRMKWFSALAAVSGASLTTVMHALMALNKSDSKNWIYGRD